MTLNENSQLFITGDVKTENINFFCFSMILVPPVSNIPSHNNKSMRIITYKYQEIICQLLHIFYVIVTL